MLIDYQYNNNKIIVSTLDDNGKIVLFTKKLIPYDWTICKETDFDVHPEYKSWDRFNVKKRKTDYPSSHTIMYSLYELDPELKKEIFCIKKLKKYFIDIETRILPTGFTEAKDATTEVLTISIVCDEKALFLGTKEISDTDKIKVNKRMNEYLKSKGSEYKIAWKTFPNEKAMLTFFFETVTTNAALLTGWNFIDYDWMFLIKRSQLIGVNYTHASPTKKFSKYKDQYILPKHKVVMDYMEIYKKFQKTVKIKESDALDFVSDKILGLKKLEYTGSLMDLYNNDYPTFALYNLIDSALVREIDKSEKYTDIMLSISNLGKIRLQDSIKTVPVTEGFLREPMLKNNIVFTDFKDDSVSKVIGGWVMDREYACLSWVVVFDFASLYPTTQREFFIAPENYLGLADANKEYAIYKDNKTKIDDTMVITAWNTVFYKKDSTTIQFLSNIYTDRKKNKKIAKDAKTKMGKIKKLKELLYR